MNGLTFTKVSGNRWESDVFKPTKGNFGVRAVFKNPGGGFASVERSADGTTWTNTESGGSHGNTCWNTRIVTFNVSGFVPEEWFKVVLTHPTDSGFMPDAGCGWWELS